MHILRLCSASGKVWWGASVVLGWGVQTLSDSQACKLALEALMAALEQLQLALEHLQLTMNGWWALLGIEA